MTLYHYTIGFHLPSKPLNEPTITECGPQLGIEPPVVGTLRADDVCWVLGESLVGVDAEGRVMAAIAL